MILLVFQEGMHAGLIMAQRLSLWRWHEFQGWWDSVNADLGPGCPQNSTVAVDGPGSVEAGVAKVCVA